jgi:hypothetical protein
MLFNRLSVKPIYESKSDDHPLSNLIINGWAFGASGAIFAIIIVELAKLFAA